MNASRMKVAAFARHGGPEVLELQQRPIPAAGHGEVRVRVRAIAVNPADLKWRQGMFQSFAPLPLPHVPGYDIAGTIDQIGPAVDGWTIGDRVFALLDAFAMGGYAEYVVIPAADAVGIPDGMDFATAASLPTAGLTGVQMAEDHARVEPGQTVLITGAVGAVGRFAAHACLRAGADIVAAVRESRIGAAIGLGAVATIILGRQDWAGGRFSHILDTVGGADVAALRPYLAPGGMIYTAATTPIDLPDDSADPVHVVVRPDPARLAALAGAVAAGGVEIPAGRCMPLASARDAHDIMEAGSVQGKIVLIP